MTRIANNGESSTRDVFRDSLPTITAPRSRRPVPVRYRVSFGGMRSFRHELSVLWQRRSPPQRSHFDVSIRPDADGQESELGVVQRFAVRSRFERTGSTVTYSIRGVTSGRADIDSNRDVTHSNHDTLVFDVDPVALIARRVRAYCRPRPTHYDRCRTCRDDDATPSRLVPFRERTQFISCW